MAWYKTNTYQNTPNLLDLASITPTSNYIKEIQTECKFCSAPLDTAEKECKYCGGPINA